jgi:hypothetical protein
MNIKYKAILITLAVFFGLIAFCYTLVEYPLVIVLIAFGGAVFLVYKAVLNYLEHNERFKK